MKLLTNLFKRDEDKMKSAMSELTEFVDRTFTSDEEKRDFHYRLAKLDAASKSIIAQTGRAALMWALAIIIVYQLVVRDFTSMAFGWALPDAGFDTQGLLKGILSILTGAV